MFTLVAGKKTKFNHFTMPSLLIVSESTLHATAFTAATLIIFLMINKSYISQITLKVF